MSPGYSASQINEIIPMNEKDKTNYLYVYILAHKHSLRTFDKQEPKTQDKY